MIALLKQIGSLAGAAVAAACCLGIPAVLAALGTAESICTISCRCHTMKASSTMLRSGSRMYRRYSASDTGAFCRIIKNSG